MPKLRSRPGKNISRSRPQSSLLKTPRSVPTGKLTDLTGLPTPVTAPLHFPHGSQRGLLHSATLNTSLLLHLGSRSKPPGPIPSHSACLLHAWVPYLFWNTFWYSGPYAPSTLGPSHMLLPLPGMLWLTNPTHPSRISLTGSSSGRPFLIPRSKEPCSYHTPAPVASSSSRHRLGTIGNRVICVISVCLFSFFHQNERRRIVSALLFLHPGT